MKPRPWTELAPLRDELRSGQLTLAQFAADLHEVTLARGKRPVYEDPEKFFELTFPTPPLRDLVKDVALRLSGKTDRAVRQLELTYGGGKTHTLVTLYHLFRDPASLPLSSTVSAFQRHVGNTLPHAHVATLCFDKIDVEKGIKDVRGPAGERRDLLYPWSVLAFQLAGVEGLRAIHATGSDEERETPPAEPLLTELLELPQKKGLSTLVLVDEVLMYVREKVGQSPVWRERMVDFFQYLIQAVVKVDRAAMVASLLATDPSAEQGDVGARLKQELFAVFRRQREEGVLPVRKEDVAEVLRRRFFERLPDDDVRRNQAISVVRDLAKLDETIEKDKARIEERFKESFPFHPDMTDVFYSRWTQLDAFQRTRGILRTLAVALQESEGWGDQSPLVGPSALLSAPGQEGVSDAVQELANVVDSDGGGPRTEWAKLLEAELNKARDAQRTFVELQEYREIEQAVISVFLHSPRSGRITTFELKRLAGIGGPDSIGFEKGLRRWRDTSWFLDDEESDDGDPRVLPKEWRLGHSPNLRQMHDEACAGRVTTASIDEGLLATVRRTKADLTGGTAALGIKVHLLPSSPAEVGDDGSFRYVVLGPEAASDPGRPSGLARRFLEEKTGGQSRVNRNAIVLAVASRDGLDIARAEVRRLLGWEEVEKQLRDKKVDPVRSAKLRRNLQRARERVPETVRHAYSIVVTVNNDGTLLAFKLPSAREPLFLRIKNDERSRIKETEVDAEALLPGGPYDLWRKNEKTRLVKDFAAPFARNPRLPKLLNSKIVRDTVLQGVRRGLLVAGLQRPDGSQRTWWMEGVDQQAAADLGLEVGLAADAKLARLDFRLLEPDRLAGLWEPGDQAVLTVDQLLRYFAGGHVAKVSRDGYDDAFHIPACPQEVVYDAIREAVSAGALWLVSGPASHCKDEIPEGVLHADAVLRTPPEPVAVQDMTEEAVPSAWKDGKTNGVALERALSHKLGEPLPWGLVREYIRAAIDSQWLETIEGRETDNYVDAGQWQLGRPRVEAGQGRPAEKLVALNSDQLQDLVGQLPGLLDASAGCGLSFTVGVSLRADTPAAVRTKVDGILEEVAPTLKATRNPR